MHYDNNTLEKSTTEVIVSIDKYVISDYKPVWTSYRMRFRLVTMIAAAFIDGFCRSLLFVQFVISSL